ncbi:MAG: cation:dicarboxylase symporter family transporter [Lachnospiraceae bacterium]|nr:cation:dicarboxylase symporter family transporter [Lachnospiraceae bacterium]
MENKKLENKKSVLMRDNASNPLLEEGAKLYRSAGFSDDQTELFTEKSLGVLNDYAELCGEGTDIEYRIFRGVLGIMVRVYIPGQAYNPFTSGKEARKRVFDNLLGMNLNAETVRLSYKYAFGRNIISVIIPLSDRKKKLLKDPMILSVVLGVTCGLICLGLPKEANSFIIDKIASPMMSILLNLMSGIMGPVIFISMTTSIVALDSINELTNLGFKIIRRFVRSTLFLIAVSIAVSALVIQHLSDGSVSFKSDKLIDLFFGVVPTNVIEPFLNNTTPQLVVMGFLMGVALLVLGDKVTELKKILMQLNEWAMSVMRIVLLAIPALPFLSILTAIAGGNGKELLRGWKFIVAVYIVFTVSVVIKAVKTSLVTGIGVREYWEKFKPAIMLSLTTSSNTAPIKKSYEITERDFGVKPEFNSFWIPMCNAMLSPKTTVNVVIAVFMMAVITGTPVSPIFLVVLIIVTLELSIASPGTASAWTIIFGTFGMPTSYVGLFTAYRLLTVNYSAACTQAYYMLEEVEAAHKLGAIKES